MQVKELKNEGLSYELEVTVTAAVIDREVDAKLKDVGKTAKMAGFRPGKVPLDILKKRYGRAVMGEVLEKSVNDSTEKALKEKGLTPAIKPKIEVKEFDEGKDLTYVMAVDVMPEFEVMDLKTLSLEKPVAAADKKAVDEALERIASENRDSKRVETDRASKKGDILVIDFHGRTKKDNKEHEGMHGHDHHLELGSAQFIGNFEEQLTGKKAGEFVEVNVTFPDPYQVSELAGEDAIFDVEIKEIRESEPVEINDEFAKKFGMEDEKALREAVEKQIQNEIDKQSRMKLKRALLDALDEGHDFPVPPGMLDMEYESILQQMKIERQDEVKDGKLVIPKDEEDELRAISERRVRLGLILSEVGNSNNIKINDQEIQRAVIAEAQRYPGQEAQIFEYYKSNQQALDALRAPVFEDKVVNFILELAVVNEKKVTQEELAADDDDDSYLEKKKEKKKDKDKEAKD